MTIQPNYNSPFIAGSMITDTSLFIGRTKELDKVTQLMKRQKPMSVNIFGSEKIGKSSLLYHFSQTRNDQEYIIVYINLQQAGCNSESGLYQELVREWQDSPDIQNRTAVQHLLQNISPLPNIALDRSKFSELIRQSKRQGVKFVICLDEFEALFNYPDEFNQGFYGNLYSLILKDDLMLLVASKKPLSLYKTYLKDQFYKMFETVKLSNLTNREVDELLQLPARVGKNSPPPVLKDNEQSEAKKWGGKHPYLLQLAAIYIYEARYQGQYAFTIARAEFNRKAIQVFWSKIVNSQGFSIIWLVLRGLFWDLPIKIGNIGALIGLTLDEFKSWIMGMMVLMVLFSGLFRIITLPVVLDWLQKIVK
ncbi:MAG TPA: ATP-binding protein [Nostocaceae cyanobacterium]|nr:ATP-binding protein [Nostocaceae cyanobacterium]